MRFSVCINDIHDRCTEFLLPRIRFGEFREAVVAVDIPPGIWVREGEEVGAGADDVPVMVVVGESAVLADSADGVDLPEDGEDEPDFRAGEGREGMQVEVVDCGVGEAEEVVDDEGVEEQKRGGCVEEVGAIDAQGGEETHTCGLVGGRTLVQKYEVVVGR